MAAPTDKSLRSDIAEILKDADLTTLSSKKIRKQLEDKYGIDLTARKSAIDKMIMELLTIEQNRQSSVSQSKSGHASVSSSSKDASKRTKREAANGDEDSDVGSDDDIEAHNAVPPKKKSRVEKEQKRKLSSDEDEDSDEKEENSEVDDEDIARQLQEEEHKAARKTRGSAKPATDKKKSSRSKKEPGSSGSSRKTNKYTEPCYLSPQLAEVMGEARLKRSDVVKKMWAIVKERNLYDPRDRRFMICDEQMQSIFGCKKVQIFGMMKYLKHHITSPGDVA